MGGRRNSVRDLRPESCRWRSANCGNRRWRYFDRLRRGRLELQHADGDVFDKGRFLNLFGNGRLVGPGDWNRPFEQARQPLSLSLLSRSARFLGLLARLQRPLHAPCLPPRRDAARPTGGNGGPSLQQGHLETRNQVDRDDPACRGEERRSHQVQRGDEFVAEQSPDQPPCGNDSRDRPPSRAQPKSSAARREQKKRSEDLRPRSRDLRRADPLPAQ